MDTTDTIAVRLKKLEEFIFHLKKYQQMTQEELETNAEKRSASERFLQLAIEASADIAEMICTRERYEAVYDAAEVIRTLGKNGVLESEFAEKFAPIVGFRNLLVHDYMKIDYAKVADKLNHRLGDFDEFARQIATYLTTHPNH